jgi:hypothetical protein
LRLGHRPTLRGARRDGWCVFGRVLSLDHLSGKPIAPNCSDAAFGNQPLTIVSAGRSRNDNEPRGYL